MKVITLGHTLDFVMRLIASSTNAKFPLPRRVPVRSYVPMRLTIKLLPSDITKKAKKRLKCCEKKVYKQEKPGGILIIELHV